MDTLLKILLWPFLHMDWSFIIGYLVGTQHTRMKVWTTYGFMRTRYRLRGWRKVDSPWPLFEKDFPGGINHRAVTWDGMDQADQRYKDCKQPGPQL